MIMQFFYQCGLIDEVTTPESYEKVDMIETCITAIREGVDDSRVISIATSYTHSLFYEILENAKNALLELSQRVLSALNNYFLNNVKIIDKYREVILDRLPKNGPVISHDTYEYPTMTDYPKPFKSTISAERDILKLQEEIMTGDPSPSVIASKVDNLLEKFGKDVLGLAPDPYNLKDSVTKIVVDTVRGKKTRVVLDRSTLGKYIDQVKNYKRDKDDITKTRKAVVDDYEALKKTYENATKASEMLKLKYPDTRIANTRDPERQAFIAQERARYSDVHVEMMRLFNGYIVIYQTAFDAKLTELHAKITDNKNVINEVITRTGLFAAVNTKDPDKNRKPIPYNPVINI